MSNDAQTKKWLLSKDQIKVPRKAHSRDEDNRIATNSSGKTTHPKR